VTRTVISISGKIFLTVFVFGAAATVAAADLSSEEITDLFSQAKEFFRQANDVAGADPEKAKDLYRKAAMRFERIASEGGIHNGRLYYNVGNAYFRLGDLGRAILYYRRAELFIPDDANLRQNLSYARSKCVDKIPEKQQTKILKTLFFWHYDLAPKTQLSLFAVCFMVLCVSASVRIFTRRAVLTWCLVISAIGGTLFFGSLLTDVVTQGRNPSGVIVASEVVARKGDGLTYDPSFKSPLHAGTEFDLIEDRSDWWHIELSDGRRCWIPDKAGAIIDLLKGVA